MLVLYPTIIIDSLPYYYSSVNIFFFFDTAGGGTFTLHPPTGLRPAYRLRYIHWNDGPFAVCGRVLYTTSDLPPFILRCWTLHGRSHAGLLTSVSRLRSHCFRAKTTLATGLSLPVHARWCSCPFCAHRLLVLVLTTTTLTLGLWNGLLPTCAPVQNCSIRLGFRTMQFHLPPVRSTVSPSDT